MTSVAVGAPAHQPAGKLFRRRRQDENADGWEQRPHLPPAPPASRFEQDIVAGGQPVGDP